MSAAKSYKSYFSFFKKYILPYISTEKKIRILDIGCGEGHLLYSFKKAGYLNCFGIDLSENKIKKSKEVISSVEAVDMFEYLDRNNEKFDLITLFDVAEHLDKKDLLVLLKRINSSLNASGMLIIHTLNAWSSFSHFYFFSDLTHKQLYSPRLMKDICGFAGFKEPKFYSSSPDRLRLPENIFSLNSLFLSLLRIVQWILWKIISIFYLLINYIVLGEKISIRTPNFIIICRK